MADHANSTPVTGDSARQRHLARAYLDLEEVVAELHGMALITDMVVAETMTVRGEARGCTLSEDRADALEYAINRLCALALTMNRAYVAEGRKVAS